MIDIHLFLGRPLLNTPKEALQQQQDSEGNSQTAAAEGPGAPSAVGGDPSKTFYYGRFPVELLDNYTEMIVEMHHIHSDLVGCPSLAFVYGHLPPQ